MQISLTQLQSYNAMFKLLDYYYKEIKLDDLGCLLSSMCFLADGDTVDSAIWEDWIDAIHDKKTLTKQEAFDGMIRFFEIYHDLTSSAEAKVLIDKLRLAKDCNDINVPIVKQWNLYLKEALNEPEGSREYLKFI
jgi:hypothetical protein